MNDTVESIKRRARILSRSLGEGHRATLDRIARAAGHSHWGSYAGSIADVDDVVVEAVHMPILLQATLSRIDLQALAFNEDGSQWTRSTAGWARLDPRHVDPMGQVRSFFESLCTGGSVLSFAMLPGGHRLAAMITHDDVTGCISIGHARRMEDSATVSNPAYVIDPVVPRDLPLLHVVGAGKDAGGRTSIKQALDGLPPCARIVTIDVPRSAVDHPNRWTLSTAAIGMGARDLAMRSQADAIIVTVDDETTAVMAADLALFHGGTARVVACMSEDGGRDDRLVRAIAARMERSGLDPITSILHVS